MKSVGLALVILLTSSALAGEVPIARDAVGYFGAPADLLVPSFHAAPSEASCGAEAPADFSKPDNAFYAPVALATGVDPIVRSELFLESVATARVWKKTGGDFDAVISEVVRLSSEAGSVRAVSAYEAASHAKVKGGPEFLAIFRRLVAAPSSGDTG